MGFGSYIGFLDVGVFSRWSLGPVVRGLQGFMGWGSLYKHKRITLGKNGAVQTPRYEMHNFEEWVGKTVSGKTILIGCELKRVRNGLMVKG